MDILRSVLGARIKALRKSRTMSQADLAELIGCDPPLIGRYERGINLPGLEQLIRIADVFGVGPGELLPGGQDVHRTRLIALREEIAQEVGEMISTDSLEAVLDLAKKFNAETNPLKR